MPLESCCRRLIGLLAGQLALLSMAAASLSAQPPITAIAFAPGGKHVLLGSQAGIQMRTWPDLKTIPTEVATELDHVHDLAFAPDGTQLLVAGGSPAEAGTVEVLSWPEAQLRRRISEHDDVVYRVAWAPGGSEWASAGADGVCQVFSSDTGEPLARYTGHSRAVLTLCYLPDGNSIASAGVDQTIQLWDSRSAVPLRTLDNHLAPVNDVALRPANRSGAQLPAIASVSDDRTVRLWQPTIGRLVRFARLPAIGQALAWSPAGDRILVGCIDGTVRVIDPDTAAITQELTGAEPQRIYAIAIEPDGSQILAAGDGQPLRHPLAGTR